MKDKIKAHLITLPRWFALPVSITAIILGGILFDAEVIMITLAVITGGLIMASGHSFNTFLDYEWTGLDKGETSERSQPKEYTVGQQPISAGILSSREVLGNAIGWLVLSAIPASFISVMVSPWIWLPWTIGALTTFWYSPAKKLWHPEIPLGFGFATGGVWLGMASSGTIDFWKGFLVSLPFFILWGGLAEHIDQWADWQPNWPKGGRSLGMLVGKLGIPLRWSIAWGVSIVYLVQIFLVSIGLLSPWTGLTFLAVLPITVAGILIDSNMKKGVIWGLGSIFMFHILMIIGQAIGG